MDVWKYGTYDVITQTRFIIDIDSKIELRVRHCSPYIFKISYHVNDDAYAIRVRFQYLISNAFQLYSMGHDISDLSLRLENISEEWRRILDHVMIPVIDQTLYVRFFRSSVRICHP